MMITAHSGCDGTEDNSMPYLRHAVSLLTEALEIDIRKDENGTPVLSHDRADGGKAVTLREAFDFLAEGDKRINCDLKEYGLEEAVLRTAADSHLNPDRLIFTGSVTDCMHFRERHPELTVFINAEELVSGFYEPYLAGRPDPAAEELLLKRCRQAGFDILNINYRVCSEKFFRRCREEGIGLSVWTVNDPADMLRMMTEGVENLTTRAVCEALKIRTAL